MIGRLLGVDYGEVRVGLALSDPLGLTAQPLVTLQRLGDKQICREIRDIVGEHRIVEIVVGMPLELSGNKGPSALKVDAFVERLGRYVNIPISTTDERLTSVAVERAFDEGQVKRKRRKEVVDQLAAVLILQGVLDLRSRDPIV